MPLADGTEVTLDASTVTVEITTVDNGIHVTPRTTLDVERKDLIGWGLSPNHMKLAERLKAAILAGKVFTKASVCLDMLGRTFVSINAPYPRARALNADLKRLGF